MDEVELGKVKYGVDKRLEEEANKFLAEGAGENRRSASRDAEKMRYEAGLISSEELHYYDPTNNWNTHDSAFVIVADPSDLKSIEPSICDVDDGNVRAENRIRVENGETYRVPPRQDLMRHVEDTDNWGSTNEEAPPLGVNKITSGKACARCKLRKRLEYFSPDPRGKHGRDGWCKECRKGNMEQIRNNSRSESFGPPTDNEE